MEGHRAGLQAEVLHVQLCLPDVVVANVIKLLKVLHLVFEISQMMVEYFFLDLVLVHMLLQHVRQPDLLAEGLNLLA